MSDRRLINQKGQERALKGWKGGGGKGKKKEEINRLGVAETAGAGGTPLVWLGIIESAHQEGEEGDQGEEHQEGG